MFIRQLQNIFIAITLFGTIFLIYTWYSNYQFKNNPLSSEIMKRLHAKELILKQKASYHYSVNTSIPIIISDKMPDKLFGAATYNQSKVTIYLNKKHFQESVDYMLDHVLPHEYAHAVMFKLGLLTQKNGGHTIKWQQICIQLGGKKCDRFVDHKDVLIGKLPIY